MRWLVLVMLTGCVTRIYDVGGTPGDPALDCRRGDALCDDVVAQLERIRRNIGGWCGTTTYAARTELESYGRAAVPYLVAVFDDRDTEVAEVAMHLTVAQGELEPVLAWCRGVHDLYRLDMCKRVLTEEALL